MARPSRSFPGSQRHPQSESGRDQKGGRRGRPKRREDGQASASDRIKYPSERRYAAKVAAKEAAPPEPDKREVRFSDLLMQLARRAAPDLVLGAKHPEPLARLAYDQELDLKNRALQEFWTARGLPDKPNRILPSPRPRGYRTTTKRRIVRKGGHFALEFLTETSAAAHSKTGSESRLEPPEHKAIYDFLLAKLNTDPYHGLANSLNYLIIRGDYGKPAVFFNLHKLNADVVRKAKLLGQHLQAPEYKVGSAFMFFDPTRSEFYFEARDPEGPWKIKKLFGPDDIRMQVRDRTYAFYPTAFCQVNASILPDFLAKAEQLLKPKPEYRLLDLYCGFGFFTLPLGKGYGEATGVDLGGPAITSAQKMAAGEKETHARFKAGRISVKTLDRLLPPPTADRPEALLLDPPRQGTEPGVIRALAARNPARILHIFCDMDTLPREVNQWRKAGFMVSKVVPLDMFPGTDDLEVMVLFIPDRYGILNRIDKERFQRTQAEAEPTEAPIEEKRVGERPKPFGERGKAFGERPKPGRGGSGTQAKPERGGSGRGRRAK